MPLVNGARYTLPYMYNSKSVDSNQAGVHERLHDIVKKHITTRYRKPYQVHNLAAFELLQQKIANTEHVALILDSCCGTGMSSYSLAARYPGHLIVGVDQSGHRLEKNAAAVPDNCIMLQANCEDIWRLCLDHNIHFIRHYILYPNPWPKSVHLKRRWHGHPVFPHLRPLAKTTILRSNWRTYLDEFNEAWELLTHKKSTVKEFTVDEAVTLFEKKYAGSGQLLFEIVVEQ